MADMTFEDLLRDILASGAQLTVPISVIQDGGDPWVSAIAGSVVVDGVVLIVLGDASGPATDAEVDARDDLLGAP